jgi:DNA-binding HxlR family transcriptional regulator
MPSTTAIDRRAEEVVVETFAISPGKWTVFVVQRLGGGKQRFNELRRRLTGISQKTLTSTLRALERDGFVERTFFPTIPPRVEYELTGPGLELLEMTVVWADFMRRHHDTIESARRRFEEATAGTSEA